MTVSGIGGLRQFLSDRESRQLEFKAASETTYPFEYVLI
jgi:hypothetical protein